MRGVRARWPAEGSLHHDLHSDTLPSVNNHCERQQLARTKSLSFGRENTDTAAENPVGAASRSQIVGLNVVCLTTLSTILSVLTATGGGAAL
jgi:hypothetical protein